MLDICKKGAPSSHTAREPYSTEKNGTMLDICKKGELHLRILLLHMIVTCGNGRRGAAGSIQDALQGSKGAVAAQDAVFEAASLLLSAAVWRMRRAAVQCSAHPGAVPADVAAQVLCATEISLALSNRSPVRSHLSVRPAAGPYGLLLGRKACSWSVWPCAGAYGRLSGHKACSALLLRESEKSASVAWEDGRCQKSL